MRSYQGAGERISVALNIDVVPKPQEANLGDSVPDRPLKP